MQLITNHLEAAKTVAVSIVWYRFDYCNSLLYGTMQHDFDQLQWMQSTGTCCSPSFVAASASDLLQELHWLPLRHHVQFKLAAVTVKAGVPAYLHDDLQDYQRTTYRMLRSSAAYLLQPPPVLTSVASRAFTITAPTVWNSLSV